MTDRSAPGLVATLPGHSAARRCAVAVGQALRFRSVHEFAGARLSGKHAPVARPGRPGRAHPFPKRNQGTTRRSGEKAAARLRDEIRSVAAEGRGCGTRRPDRRAAVRVESGGATRCRAQSPLRPGQAGTVPDAAQGVAGSTAVPAAAANATLAFFEAHLSNFVEGVEFAAEEAADIAPRGVVPEERPQDASGVLGTWRLVSDHREITRIPGDFSAFEDCLRSRPAAIMAGCPDMRPGAFKRFANPAGSTDFVVPDLVEGALGRGFALLQPGHAFPARRVRHVSGRRSPPLRRRQRTHGASGRRTRRRRRATHRNGVPRLLRRRRPFRKAGKQRPAHSITPGPQPWPGVRSMRQDAN